MPQEPESHRNALLSLLASSVGLSGILVAIGFVIQQAVNRMIGFRIRRGTNVTECVIDAAGFAMDTLAVVVEHAALSVLVLMVLVAAFLLACRFITRVRQFSSSAWKRYGHPPYKRIRGLLSQRWLCVILVALAVLLKLMYVDWPVVIMRNFFEKPATPARAADFGAPSFLQDDTAKLWTDFLDAHSLDRATHSRGRGRLEDRYWWSVLLAVLITIACIILLGRQRGGASGMLLVAFLLFELFLTAYTYGKYEKSTYYPCVSVALGGEGRIERGLLISDDSHRMLLFMPADDRFHDISTSQVREVVTIANEDLFGAHLLAVSVDADPARRAEAAAMRAKLKAAGRLPRCME